MLLIRRACGILLSISALLFTAIYARTAQAQIAPDGRWENGVSEPWSFTDETTWQAEIIAAQLRWKQIGDEAGTSERNEWAGDYFLGGDTSGIFLRWSPKNGFVVMNVNKCAAYVRNFSYGRVKVTPNLIEFHAEKAIKPSSLDRGDPYKLPVRFIPVKWRGVAYLIQEKEMADFGDYIAGLGNHNAGLVGYSSEGAPFFGKVGLEETGSADDPPAVPTGYERFIKRPISAKIIAVGARSVQGRQSEPGEELYYESETAVTIDAGRADGVKTNMSFYVLTPGSAEEVKIRRVREHSSSGVIVRFLKEDASRPPFLWKDEEDMSYSPITVGWELSTSQFKLADLNLTEDRTDALSPDLH